MAAVPEFQAIGGESSLDTASRDALASVRKSSRVDYTAVRLLKRTALRSSFGRFYEREWQRDTPRAAEFRLFVARRARVARRLRALSGTARPRRTAVDGVAGAAVRSRARGDRRGTPRARGGNPLLRISPVDRRHRVAGGPARCPRQRRRAFRRPAVHGRREQRRRLGASGKLPPRRLDWRAARCVQCDGTGLGHAALPVG